MIAREALTEGLDRLHVGGSIVSAAGNYLKGAWSRRRCLVCIGTGGRKCSKCDGKGLVAGDGSSTSRELCRRCIGTGREECAGCEGAGFVTSVPAIDH